MYTKTPHAILFSALLVMIMALAPSTAFAEEDATAAEDIDEAAETVADDQAVTLEEMTTEEADTDAESEQNRETLQQQETTADNPSLARTIGLNALWGGVAGGVIGLGFYLLTGMDTTPWVIAQFAGGGILVGGTIGLITGLATAEPDPGTRAYEPPSSVDYVEQHAPETFDVPVLQKQF